MDREILLGITGMQWEMMDDGEQKAEDAEAVEMLTSADYFFKNGKHYFVYDETAGSGRKIGKSKIKITGDRTVEIMKAGEMRGSLFFEKDKRTLTCYETPYGQLHFGVWTTGIDVDVKEDEILAEIRYRMEMEDKPMADCCVKIHACSKGEKSAQMVRELMEHQKQDLIKAK